MFIEVFLFCLSIPVAILTIIIFIGGIKYFAGLHWHKCRYCNHCMQYKGLKTDNRNGHHLFYCPHCGSWQQMPTEDYFKHW